MTNPDIGHNGGPPLDTSLGDDTLNGIRAIAAFIGERERRTFYLCERGYLPVGKLGSGWVASKAVLRAHYARITGAVA
jgi:hypothetical protein